MEIPKGELDVVAIGETLIDFISDEVADSLQEASTFCRYQGGSPANIAVNVARLGGKAAVISKVGIGAFGQYLKGELQRHGVITDYLIMDHRVHSSIVFVSRTHTTPDFEAFRSGDYQLTPAEISEEALSKARVVHSSTWPLSREPSRSAVYKAFQIAFDQGKIVSLDPNYSPRIWPEQEEAIRIIKDLYRYATITKPSRDDAQRLFGSGYTNEQYIEMFHEMGAKLVVLTMGKDGMFVSQDGMLLGHIPARPVQIVDATGAGDSFWAGFLIAMLDGNSPERCALFAREIVELKLTRIGPLPGSMDKNEIYARLAH